MNGSHLVVKYLGIRQVALIYFIVVLLVLLGACSGETPTPPAPTDTSLSPEATGETIFNEIVLERNGIAVQGCVACHTIDPSAGEVVGLVGPNLAGVATRATARVPGTPAEAYLRTSITDPTAYTVEGFDSSTKPMNYTELFTDEELDSLVAYLMTLK